MPLLDHFRPPLRNRPTLPLFIDADQAVPIDLETTYAEACEDIRLDAVPVPA